MLKRREQAICPCCGQRLLIRHSVQLSPVLADLLDMIERCQTGITRGALAEIFYPWKNSRDGRNCVSVNIHHLNARLAETNIEIRAGKPDAPYLVIKRRNP